MNKSIEEMYENLINGIDDFNNDDFLSNDNLTGFDPDDVEDFTTSKELIKAKEDLEEKFGIVAEEHEIEEDTHFKIYNKRREHKYTETELAAIKESCIHTIVHDYGPNDFYHQTDEERAENDVLSEIGLKLGCLKRTYRKIDQYIEAMRVVVQAWELLERNNYVHTSDEFFQLVASGTIVSNRIIMPKMKRIDRYNMDIIIKYISNPELDPSVLVPIKEEKKDFDLYDSFYVDVDTLKETDEKFNKYYTEFIDKYKEEHPDDEDFDPTDIEAEAIEYVREQIELEEMERLLSPEEVEYINSHADNPEVIKVTPFKYKWIKGYNKRSFSSSKKVKKKDKYIIQNIHEMLNKIQSNPNNHTEDYTRSYMLTDGMFEINKGEKDFWENLRFDGSWADDNDVFLYNLAVQEELLKQHPPKETYLTYGEKELATFFNILERNGVNVIELRRKMNCTQNDYDKEKSEKSKKENRKIESAIIQRISKLNENPKFKKIVNKAEKALNEYNENS